MIKTASVSSQTPSSGSRAWFGAAPSAVVQTGMEKGPVSGRRERMENGDTKGHESKTHLTSNCFNTQIGELRRMTINFLGRSSKRYLYIYIYPSIHIYLPVYLIFLSLCRLLKIPQTGWLINNMNLFLTVLKARKSKVRVPTDSMSETLFLVLRWLFFH